MTHRMYTVAVTALAIVLPVLSAFSAEQELPAFPSAEGWGAQAVGGRGGRILEVTNLNDAGPGSFREAVEASGPRIVVFRVAGIITLEDVVHIRNPYITIAGQSAPGGGILLRGRPHVGVIIYIRGPKAHDVIIRYLRIRQGKMPEFHQTGETIQIREGHNIIIDHVSASWTNDEVVESWRTRSADPAHEVYNVTFQRMLIAEPLNPHPTGFLRRGRVFHR